jgi:hypothetical protein
MDIADERLPRSTGGGISAEQVSGSNDEANALKGWETK